MRKAAVTRGFSFGGRRDSQAEGESLIQVRRSPGGSVTPRLPAFQATKSRAASLKALVVADASVVFFARGAPIDPRSIERRWVGAVGYPSQCQLACTDAKARLDYLIKRMSVLRFVGTVPEYR